jgi:hypothetical protein
MGFLDKLLGRKRGGPEPERVVVNHEEQAAPPSDDAVVVNHEEQKKPKAAGDAPDADRV